MSKEKQEPKTENGPINLRQLSELLHLSQTTISLVLNDSPSAKSIPQHTRDRVFEAARKFQYRPNYFARSLRRSKSTPWWRTILQRGYVNDRGRGRRLGLSAQRAFPWS